MRVNIAQPALSTQVQALEKFLGVQLLLRSTRRVELTRAGEVFYDRCVRMLSDLDLSAEMARSVAGKTVREIRIGTIYPATTGVLPAFLSRIGRKYPDIRLHVSNGSTSDIIRQLECGRINLGFIRPVENIGSLRFFSIAHERYLLAVARDNPLAGFDEVCVSDLRDQKIIGFQRRNLSYTERYFPRSSRSTIWPAMSPIPATTSSTSHDRSRGRAGEGGPWRFLLWSRTPGAVGPASRPCGHRYAEAPVAALLTGLAGGERLSRPLPAAAGMPISCLMTVTSDR